MGSARIQLTAVLALAALPLPALDVRVVNGGTGALPAGELTVATYNVLHGFADRINGDTLEVRLEHLVSELASMRPDVLILQEVSVTRRHGNVVDRLRDGLNRALAGRGNRYGSALALNHGSFLIGFHEGSAVLARGEILEAQARVYRTQALIPPERRIALRVSIRRDGGPLTVVGTHLTHREEKRAGLAKRVHQARELGAWVAEWGARGPLVVGGDLNDGPASATVRAMLDRGLTDAWAAIRRAEPGLTSLPGEVDEPDQAPNERIDYLFVSGQRILEAWLFLDQPIDGLWVSDHLGVAARLD